MGPQVLCYKFYTYRSDCVECERWVRARRGWAEGDPSHGWVLFFVPLQYELGFLNLWRDHVESLPQRNID